LFEDAGWKHVYGTKNSGNQYFLPMNEKAGTDIFRTGFRLLHDIKLIPNLFGEYCMFYILLMHYIISVGGDLSKLAFLTPGLWERTGRAFWSAFFFELPFVLLRMTPLVFFMTVIVSMVIGAQRLKRIMKLL